MSKNFDSLEFFTLATRHPEMHLAQDGIWYLLRLLALSGLLAVPREHEGVQAAVASTWRFLSGSDAAPEEIRQWEGQR